eukprot:8000313-Pyramimonas_sp.AAC.1
MMFLFATASMHDLEVHMGDIENAFCQSDPLKRPRWRVCAGPREGFDLPAGALIELVALVYGLD